MVTVHSDTVAIHNRMARGDLMGDYTCLMSDIFRLTTKLRLCNYVYIKILSW